MAHTTTVVRRSAAGGMGGDPRTLWVDVNITSYTSGGEPVPPSEFGLATVLFAACEQAPGRLVRYDRATNEVLVHQDATPAAAAALPEVPAATNVGTVRIRFDGLEI